MSKWARVNLQQDSQILEVITYDPNGVINEAFLPEFKSCPDEVEKGYHYNPQTDTFYLPEGYAKHPNFETFGYVPKGDLEVDENGFIIFPPAPKQITVEDLRSKLILTEKILWDNPETGTASQTAVINTAKLEFPVLSNDSTLLDLLKLLETNTVIGKGRAQKIYDALVA